MPRCFPLRLRGALAWGTLACLAAFGTHAQTPSLDSAAKATYLHKFAPFVEWPSPAAEFPDGNFTLCVVGNDTLGPLLDRAARSQTVAGHAIEIRRMVSVTGKAGCSVMYVTGSGAQSVADALVAVRGLPVLTVTDGATDPAAAGIINFVIADDRVRFDIDKAKAATDGLIISSKLLSVAVHVIGGGQ